MKVLVIQTCMTLATIWTVARQALLSIEFPRQRKYWSRVAISFSEVFQHQVCALQEDSFAVLSHQESPLIRKYKTSLAYGTRLSPNINIRVNVFQLS